MFEHVLILCIIYIFAKSQQEGECNVSALLINSFVMHNYLLAQHFAPFLCILGPPIPGEVSKITILLLLILDLSVVPKTPYDCYK